jgi:large repetitive protein
MRLWNPIIGLVLSMSLVACDDKDTDDTDDTGDVEVVDIDGDGVSVEDGDCDDNDASVYPDATEECDEIDNNCDGAIDEDLQGTYYEDADGDGFGNAEVTMESCEAPEGYTEDSTDCDDTSADVSPGADEVCDGADNNCDGTIDEETATDATTWYMDADTDTYGDPAVSMNSCDQPEGYVEDMTDCNDQSATDFPGADELCDGADNNCDTFVDEDSATDASTWYMDSDADTFGDPAVSMNSCSQPTGYVADMNDCDDAVDTINPDADEYCDAIDNNCDGTIDEDNAMDASSWYMDADTDTFGDPAVSMNSCSQPTGYVADMNDCDDSVDTINPDADELCTDTIDENCDGDTILDAVDTSTWYDDYDSDTYGDPNWTMDSCTQPTGYVANALDCDDFDSTSTIISDDADCDGTLTTDDCDDNDASSTIVADDGDCDGTLTDDDCDDNNPVSETVFTDGDCDGALTGTDCDDSDPSLNEMDLDQDGVTTCGADYDGDGVIGFDERDCDDYNNTVMGIDNDGDGFSVCLDDCDDNDEYTNTAMGTSEADTSLCVTDWDGDGYGSDDPMNGVDAGTDCDDADEDINADDIDGDGVSTCDGDCDDNDTSIGIVDYDGDGYSFCNVDCWDTILDVDGDGVIDSSLMYPGAAANEPELCGIDADGDGWADADPYTPLPAGCFQLTLYDLGSYWDSAAITVSVDGVLFGEYANTSGSYQNFEVCTPSGEVSLSYECTSSYDCGNHAYYIYYDLNFDGTYTSSELMGADGNTITGGEPAQGIIADSNFGDLGSDCDDTDASTIGDVDGDGYTWCEDDCDDNDNLVNPMATETYYDGIDANCDGMSDYDADGDGEDIAQWDCDGDGVNDESCDLDGDGADDWWAGADCDDADDSSIGDDDGDGYTFCVDDCDDTDSSINPGAFETYYDNIDSNCDGASDFDYDGDGDDVAAWDCDGDGFNDSSCDIDGDGMDDYIAGFDCDDDNYDLNGLDWDNDGQSSCDGDCDDQDEYTYLGAAYIDDPSGMYCATDADGDGYAPMGGAAPCYTVSMTDSYGDGWNGGYLIIYEDGVEVDSGLPADGSYLNQSAGRFFISYGSSETASFCATPGSTIEMYYGSGSWEGENYYTVTDDNTGAVVYSDGPNPSTGTVFSWTLAWDGTDPDDSDSSVIGN